MTPRYRQLQSLRNQHRLLSLTGPIAVNSGTAEAATACLAERWCEHYRDDRLPLCSEGGAAACKQHAKHGPPGGDSTHGQSGLDLHASEDGTATAKQHANRDPPRDDSTHGQSQRDLHASEDGAAAAADQHAKHDAIPGSDAKPGQSPRDLNTAPENASNSSHLESKLNAEGKRQAIDHAGLAETAAASELGDSFHFKNEMAASKASDILEVHVGYRPDFVEDGPHTGGDEGEAPIQDSDLIGFSHIVDHANVHASDFIVHP